MKETVIDTAEGKHRSISLLPKTYFSDHPHLEASLIVFLTKYPLALDKNKNYEDLNLFAVNVPANKRFLFVSTYELRSYCKKAYCTFEEGIVFLVIGQMAGHFLDIKYHTKTKNCVMDYCENRDDIVYGLIARSFCRDCELLFPENDVKSALLTILRWRFRPGKLTNQR